MSTWGRRGLSRAVRTRILDRDGHVCQLGYDGCTYIATEIDDIVPVSQLGGVSREELTDDNRQSACHACHAVRLRPNGWPRGGQHSSVGVNACTPPCRTPATADSRTPPSPKG